MLMFLLVATALEDGVVATNEEEGVNNEDDVVFVVDWLGEKKEKLEKRLGAEVVVLGASLAGSFTSFTTASLEKVRPPKTLLEETVVEAAAGAAVVVAVEAVRGVLVVMGAVKVVEAAVGGACGDLEMIF